MGSYRYRFRFANYGMRDLNEITIKAKNEVNLSKKNHTFLDVGNGGFVPVLKRRKKNRITSQVFSLYIGEEALKEFQKSFYKKDIKEKAKSGELSLDNLFDVYSESVTITLYLFGNDSVTGARRLFVSKGYKKDDVRDGIFCPVQVGCHTNRKSTVEHISKIYKNN